MFYIISYILHWSASIRPPAWLKPTFLLGGVPHAKAQRMPYRGPSWRRVFFKGDYHPGDLETSMHSVAAGPFQITPTAACHSWTLSDPCRTTMSVMTRIAPPPPITLLDVWPCLGCWTPRVAYTSSFLASAISLACQLWCDQPPTFQRKLSASICSFGNSCLGPIPPFPTEGLPSTAGDDPQMHTAQHSPAEHSAEHTNPDIIGCDPFRQLGSVARACFCIGCQ